VVREGAAKPALLEHVEHLGRRMRECSVLASQELPHNILSGDEKTRNRVAWRMAEDKQAASGATGRCKQSLVVRIAADDAVQNDDVVLPARFGIYCDVIQPPFGMFLDPSLTQESHGFVVVGRRQLEVQGVCGAPLQ
jgi:hypothetical protein